MCFCDVFETIIKYLKILFSKAVGLCYKKSLFWRRGEGWFKRDGGVSRGVVATSKETMQVMWCHNGFPARNHTCEGLFVSFWENLVRKLLTSVHCPSQFKPAVHRKHVDFTYLLFCSAEHAQKFLKYLKKQYTDHFLYIWNWRIWFTVISRH